MLGPLKTLACRVGFHAAVVHGFGGRHSSVSYCLWCGRAEFEELPGRVVAELTLADWKRVNAFMAYEVPRHSPKRSRR